MKKEKVTKADYHESADRLSIIQHNLEDFVRASPAVQKHKHLVEKIDKAQSDLYDVYSELALRMFEDKNPELITK